LCALLVFSFSEYRETVYCCSDGCLDWVAPVMVIARDRDRDRDSLTGELGEEDLAAASREAREPRKAGRLPSAVHQENA